MIEDHEELLAMADGIVKDVFGFWFGELSTTNIDLNLLTRELLEHYIASYPVDEEEPSPDEDTMRTSRG